MPILNGIEAAKRIRQVSPPPRMVFATQNRNPDIKAAALATGAEGYLLKINAGSGLLPAIEAALKHGHGLTHTSPAEEEDRF